MTTRKKSSEDTGTPISKSEASLPVGDLCQPCLKASKQADAAVWKLMDAMDHVLTLKRYFSPESSSFGSPIPIKKIRIEMKKVHMKRKLEEDLDSEDDGEKRFNAKRKLDF